VLRQQPKGQLQTQHSVETGNYVHYRKTQSKDKINYRQALVEDNNNNNNNNNNDNNNNNNNNNNSNNVFHEVS
jgi:hypothetical protein